jgi:hypothetical protein
MEGQAMKKTAFFIYTILFMLLAMLATRVAVSADEIEYILQEEITSVTPVFMEGYVGNIEKIKGFLYSGNLFLDGLPVGTFSGELSALNPPISLTEPYQHGTVTGTYNLPGIGTFQANSQTLQLTSSTTPLDGKSVVAWSGSLSNGTGALSNVYGLSSGVGVVDQFAGTGELTEVFRIRFGGF